MNAEEVKLALVAIQLLRELLPILTDLVKTLVDDDVEGLSEEDKAAIREALAAETHGACEALIESLKAQ